MSRQALEGVRGSGAGLAGSLTFVVLLLCAASAGPALGSVGRVGALSSDAAAVALLQRAAAAPSRVAYSGVQFVSAWSATGATSLVVDVNHLPGQGTTVRSGSTTQTRAGSTFLPADNPEPSVVGLASTLDLLAGNYTVVLAGRTAVAGRAVQVVAARWPGKAGAAARFWLDTATGLVLRREVYDRKGRTTRASAFVQIQVGAAKVQADLPPAMPDPWSQEVDYSGRAAMRAKGWSCPDSLPGQLTLVDARRGGADKAGILHLSYSDGLAAVSVFEQRGRLDVANLQGYVRTDADGYAVYVRDGVPKRVVWSAKGKVFTVVADAPPRTVDRVVASLPHDASEGGAWHRLGRGLDRVGSWFNPFG